MRGIISQRNFKYFSKIYYAVGSLFLIILFGLFGFMIIEDYGFLDAFYMTIISVSTVGFGVLHDLSDSGKLFTSILIITSFGIFAYSISAITTYVVGGEFKRYFTKYKVNTKIKNMKGHVIVVGHGRNGKQATVELRKYNQQFVLVERDNAMINKIRMQEECKDMLIVEGDATQDSTLLNAGIKDAKAMIITLPNDADNLYVVLTARSLNSKLIIISRSSNDSSVKKLRIAGADNVIMPDKVGGAHMASLVMKPDIIEFLDNIFVQDNMHSNLVEITCSELPANLKNLTIKDLDIRSKSGANIIGYKTPEGNYVINPTPDTKLIPNAKLFVLGKPKQINKLQEIVKQKTL